MSFGQRLLVAVTLTVALGVTAVALAKAPVIISGDVTLTTTGASGGDRLVVKLLERTSSGSVIERAWTQIAISDNTPPPYHFELPAVDSSTFSRAGSTYSIQASIALNTSIRFQDSKAYTPGSMAPIAIAIHPSTGYLPYTAGPTDTPTPLLPTDSPIAATALPSAKTPTAVSPPDLGATADATFKMLPTGNMMYNPPEEMTIGEHVNIEVRITQSITQNLTSGLQGPGTPVVEALIVGSFMNVTLSGDNDKFKITALNHKEEQFVGRSDFTPWTWDVVPLEAGDQILYLTVTVIIKTQGRSDVTKDYPVKKTTIKVRVNPAYSVQKFVGTNWQWLLTAIVIPLVVVGWNIWRKKKEPLSPVMTPQAHRPETMLNTEEVAEQLNISATAVRRLISTGALPAFHIGNQLRIKQQDIDAYLQRQQIGSKKR